MNHLNIKKLLQITSIVWVLFIPTLSPATMITETDVLSNLPHHVQTQILKYIDGRALITLSQVSRQFSEVSQHDALWFEVCQRAHFIDPDEKYDAKKSYRRDLKLFITQGPRIEFLNSTALTGKNINELTLINAPKSSFLLNTSSTSQNLSDFYMLSFGSKIEDINTGHRLISFTSLIDCYDRFSSQYKSFRVTHITSDCLNACGFLIGLDDLSTYPCALIRDNIHDKFQLHLLEISSITKNKKQTTQNLFDLYDGFYDLPNIKSFRYNRDKFNIDDLGLTVICKQEYTKKTMMTSIWKRSSTTKDFKFIGIQETQYFNEGLFALTTQGVNEAIAQEKQKDYLSTLRVINESGGTISYSIRSYTQTRAKPDVFFGIARLNSGKQKIFRAIVPSTDMRF